MMVNEGYLQELEKRIAEIREKGGGLVTAMNGSNVSFPDGMDVMVEYTSAVEVLREVGGQLFDAIDLCDPEDNELLSREEDEEEEEGEEEDEDEEEDDEEDEEERRARRVLRARRDEDRS